MARLPHAKFRLRKAYSRATRITPSFSDMPPSSGGDNGSRVESGFLLIEAAQQNVDSIESEIREMRARLRPYIERLGTETLEARAMRMRYMEGRSVREMEIRLNYSPQYLFKILSRAEKKVNEFEKEES